MEANTARDFQRLINPDESELVRHARTGEVDGTKEYPPLLTQGWSDHEKQIIYEGKTEWMKYTSLVEQYRARLGNQIHQLQNQHDSELHNRIDGQAEGYKPNTTKMVKQLSGNLAESVAYHLASQDFITSEFAQVSNSPRVIPGTDKYRYDERNLRVYK